jgi:carbon monoxide dehydrogenase subunit G
MEFKGRYTITAAPATVWSALNDPAVLARCIPGCQTLERISPSEFKASVEVRIGPVKASFAGKVSITPQTPEPGYSHAAALQGEGQGGAAGFAKGTSEVRLTADNGATVLTYDAKANVGGRLAQIGQRLIDGAAKGIADEFFARFAQEVQSREPEPQSQASAPPPAARGLPTPYWLAGLIAAILALVALFSFLP